MALDAAFPEEQKWAEAAHIKDWEEHHPDPQTGSRTSLWDDKILCSCNGNPRRSYRDKLLGIGNIILHKSFKTLKKPQKWKCSCLEVKWEEIKKEKFYKIMEHCMTKTTEN